MQLHQPEGDNVVPVVVRPEAVLVNLVQQEPRQPVGPLVELPVRDAPARLPVDQGGLVGSGRVGLEHLLQEPVDHRVLGMAHLGTGQGPTGRGFFHFEQAVMVFLGGGGGRRDASRYYLTSETRVKPHPRLNPAVIIHCC